MYRKQPVADNPPEGDPSFPTDADVASVLAEFDGDARATIRALLHDIAVLAEDYEATVSRGFVRGAIPRIMLKRRPA